MSLLGQSCLGCPPRHNVPWSRLEELLGEQASSVNHFTFRIVGLYLFQLTIVLQMTFHQCITLCISESLVDADFC